MQKGVAGSLFLFDVPVGRSCETQHLFEFTVG